MDTLIDVTRLLLLNEMEVVVWKIYIDRFWSVE
jgi:hypothetical protein